MGEAVLHRRPGQLAIGDVVDQPQRPAFHLSHLLIPGLSLARRFAPALAAQSLVLTHSRLDDRRVEEQALDRCHATRLDKSRLDAATFRARARATLPTNRADEPGLCTTDGHGAATAAATYKSRQEALWTAGICGPRLRTLSGGLAARLDLGPQLLAHDAQVLRRLDCVLEPTKAAVLAELELRTEAGVNPEPFLKRKAGQSFFNTSARDLKRLLGDPANVGPNLHAYVQGFSAEVRDIFERFEFAVQIDRLAKAKLLYQAPRNRRIAIVSSSAGAIATSTPHENGPGSLRGHLSAPLDGGEELVCSGR